ncbi:Fic family protein [Flavobacteriales bacterium]|nr:Fic family protein [Flavobacteriales bacterium]
MYAYQHKNWPNWNWDEKEVLALLIEVISKQNKLLGKLSILGFDIKERTALETGVLDVIKNSGIEGEELRESHVRSSIAKNLGLNVEEDDSVKLEATEGAINMFIDSTRNYKLPMTPDRLFDWHSGLFPTGRSAGKKIVVANWRLSKDPMQIVSGAMGREKVHYEAPSSEHIPGMMNQLIDYINSGKDHPMIMAAISHLWFEVIHPFDDGNGRIGRAIADTLLCRADELEYRYYSFSNAVLQNKKEYYSFLNKASKGDLNITEWIEWFLKIVNNSIDNSEKVLEKVDFKRKFWENYAGVIFNDRQLKVLGKLLDGFEGYMTSSKWTRMTKCTRMTATRDINDLIEKDILLKNESGGRSTSYKLNDRF